MKVVYLGYAVSTNEARFLSGVSVAGNKMQVNILKELAKYSDLSLTCFTVYPVAAWPKEKQWHITRKDFAIDEEVKAQRIPFLNFPIIKQLNQAIGVYQAAKKVVNENTIVLAFNLYPQVGLPLMWLKKKHRCKTCAIFADPPIDDKTSRSVIGRYLRSIFDHLTRKAIDACDGMIVLNENAVKQYAPQKPYAVVEGGVAKTDFSKESNCNQPERKNLIYSGALTEYSGILQLIDAMQLITDDDAVLEIYGGGYLEEDIRSRCAGAKNVCYCGTVSNAEMIKIQREAYLLVNPRPINDPITKVTFPSKLFEYMLSATPVLTTKINGLTEEYLQHLYFTKDDSPVGLAEAINAVLRESETVLREKGAEAQKFVRQAKTWEKQCEKIHQFLLEMEGSDE